MVTPYYLWLFSLLHLWSNYIAFMLVDLLHLWLKVITFMVIYIYGFG